MIEPKKKKPGRPKKQVESLHYPKLGIVSTPSVIEDDIITMEMRYANPIMFKKLFSLLRKFSVSTINMHFYVDHIKITSKCHKNINDLVYIVYGSRLHKYYCAKTLDISVDAADVLNIMDTIDKDYSLIHLYTKGKTERSKIYIRLFHPEMKTDDIYEVDTKHASAIDPLLIASLDKEVTYPLKFCVKTKFFKRKINNISKMADIINLSKYGDKEVNFISEFNSKKTTNNCVLGDSDVIKLQSHIEPGRIFCVSAQLENIKPVFSSFNSEEIYISAHLEDKLIFTIYLDQEKCEKKKEIKPDTEICVVKVLSLTYDARSKS